MDHLIHVDALQYNDIVGHSSSSIILDGPKWWSLNMQVTISEWSVNESKPTGRWCVRYIVASVLVRGGVVDDKAWLLHLSPFKNESEPLGLSRVRKSDNLESF